MRKRNKVLIWLSGAVLVVVLLSYMVDLELIREDAIVEGEHVGNSNQLYDGFETGCRSDGRPLMPRLREHVKSGDKKCFVAAIKEAHFAESDVRDEVAQYLAALIDSYYSDRPDKVSILLNEYSRLEALNYVTPYALRREVKVNVGAIRSDVLRETKATHMSTRRTALAVLSYFRDDGDIQIFSEILRTGSDEDVVMAIAALVNNCSPKAKAAISEGLKFPNVRSYLTRYQSKETITALIQSECPLESNRK